MFLAGWGNRGFANLYCILVFLVALLAEQDISLVGMGYEAYMARVMGLQFCLPFFMFVVRSYCDTCPKMVECGTVATGLGGQAAGTSRVGEMHAGILGQTFHRILGTPPRFHVCSSHPVSRLLYGPRPALTLSSADLCTQVLALSFEFLPCHLNLRTSHNERFAKNSRGNRTWAIWSFYPDPTSQKTSTILTGPTSRRVRAAAPTATIRAKGLAAKQRGGFSGVVGRRRRDAATDTSAVTPGRCACMRSGMSARKAGTDAMGGAAEDAVRV